MGNILRQEMVKKDLSFRDLAFMSGYDPGFLCRVANGQRQPSREAALKIARALGVSPLRLWK